MQLLGKKCEKATKNHCNPAENWYNTRNTLTWVLFPGPNTKKAKGSMEEWKTNANVF
jgi:hypothetical protein